MELDPKAFEVACEAYYGVSPPSHPPSRAGLVAAIEAYLEASQPMPLVIPDTDENGS